MRNKLPVLLLVVTMVIGSFAALTLTLSAAGPADMKRRVAFHSKRSGNWDIWVMDADGKNLGQLTTDPATDAFPAWSADGCSIAFHSKRSGNWDIWVMDADGKNLRQLIADAAGDRGLAWSPMAMAIVLPRPS